MSLKKINFLKTSKPIGLSLIVLCLAYGSLRGDIGLPQRNENVVKDIRLNPIISNTALRDSIVSFGMELLGTPYVEASCGKNGFDCSGFVYFVFQHFKIEVPRSSSGFEHFGKEILIENVKKGDILVFLSPSSNVIGHVGIVTNPKGMDSDFIHASSSSEMKVIISSLKQKGYTRRFVKAVSVL